MKQKKKYYKRRGLALFLCAFAIRRDSTKGEKRTKQPRKTIRREVEFSVCLLFSYSTLMTLLIKRAFYRTLFFLKETPTLTHPDLIKNNPIIKRRIYTVARPEMKPYRSVILKAIDRLVRDESIKMSSTPPFSESRLGRLQQPGL